MQELENLSPVLKYKNQNEKDLHGDLDQVDFFLVLMTEFQAQQLSQFGRHKICIDGTHGTNAYDIQLYTLLVVDEYGAGCPVAFCFSNRSDEYIFKLFFEAIKERVGEINTTVFMSDDAPAFYNAWSSVMGNVLHRLICSWHVDRNWRQNLNKISNLEKRSVVYKTLKVLLHLDDKDKFNEALSKVLADLFADSDTVNFGIYFQKYYVKRTETWAYCFRQHLGINTNMYLESVHKILKYYYLEGKKTRRLDKTIHAVMKLARDSLFNRIIKLSKNTSSLRIKHIQLAHNNSKTVTSAMITVLESNEWLVQSCSISGQEYIVQKNKSSCNISNCELKCSRCEICVHIYKCSCMDNVIKFNICKHIHAVSSYGQINDLPIASSSEEQNIPKIEKHMEIDNIISTVNPCAQKQNLIGKKIDLILGLRETASLNSDEEVQVLKHLDKIINIMNKNKIKFSEEKELNINKNIDTQIRLFSVKKKQSKKNSISKPSVFETKNIKDSFEGTAKTMVFNSTDDHTYI